MKLMSARLIRTILFMCMSYSLLIPLPVIDVFFQNIWQDACEETELTETEKAVETCLIYRFTILWEIFGRRSLRRRVNLGRTTICCFLDRFQDLMSQSESVLSRKAMCQMNVFEQAGRLA